MLERADAAGRRRRRRSPARRAARVTFTGPRGARRARRRWCARRDALRRGGGVDRRGRGAGARTAGAGRHGRRARRSTPGAANVIPGRVARSLDVRHADDARARGRGARRCASARAGGRRAARGVAVDWEVVQATRRRAAATRRSPTAWPASRRRSPARGVPRAGERRRPRRGDARRGRAGRDAVRPLRAAASATTRTRRCARTTWRWRSTCIDAAACEELAA